MEIKTKCYIKLYDNECNETGQIAEFNMTKNLELGLNEDPVTFLVGRDDIKVSVLDINENDKYISTVSINEKEKEMTLEDIEKELGYKVKLITDNQYSNLIHRFQYLIQKSQKTDLLNSDKTELAELKRILIDEKGFKFDELGERIG